LRRHPLKNQIPPHADIVSSSPSPSSPKRRRVLNGLAGGIASGLLWSKTAQAAESVGATQVLEPAPWTLEPGAPLLSPPYGVPASFESKVIRRVARPPALPGSGSLMTPLADLFGSITPNGLFYERHHAGVPQIDPDQHRLAIHGLVRKPHLFTLDDLLRFPSESHIHFLECPGNTGSEWNGPSGLPVQLTHGLLSCCEWTGVRLSTLLDETGVDPTARWLLAEGSDGAAMTRSLPLDRILDRALVVYAQNGERLRPENGYPLRLIVPVFEGNTNSNGCGV
jgi:sulfane dehydrogenase subunit SoxC